MNSLPRLSRRSFAYFGAMAAGGLIAGCASTTPPTTQPTTNPAAAQALADAESVEAIAMTVISVAYNANLIPATDYNAAVAADKVFQSLASGIGLEIADGTPLTAADISAALAEVLASIKTVEAKTPASKASAAKAMARAKK